MVAGEKEASRRGPTRTVLVFDTSGGPSTALRRALSPRHRVRVYASAAEALASWRQEGADVVVLALPLDDEACGVDVLRSLREDAYVPIVIVGSDDSLPDPPAAYGMGATFCVPGPDARHHELLHAVGLVLDDRHGLRHPFYREDEPAGPGRRWRRMQGDSPAMQEVFAWLQQTCRYLVALTELDPVTGAIRASTPPEGLRLDPQALAREVERAHIERVLRAAGGNVSRAASALDWGRGKLLGRMRALGLSRHGRDRDSITGDQDSITVPDE